MNRRFSCRSVLMPAVLLFAISVLAQRQSEFPDPSLNHPDFKPSVVQTKMPESVLIVKRTEVVKAKYPVIDIHFHGRDLETAEDYRELLHKLDSVGVAIITNLNMGFREVFDRHIDVGKPFSDRVIPFARVDWEEINSPGWSQRAAAELERMFQAGAQGLKIWKDLGLQLRNPDGSYIHSDDPRLAPIWQTCAEYNRPVLMHLSDAIARFHPIGPANERYEAGLWRESPEGNYYGTGQPTHDQIFVHWEKMIQQQPKTIFVMAHFAETPWDLARVANWLERYPNMFVEFSSRLAELGRQPYTARRFFLKYQDRILFGSDNNPSSIPDEEWRPYWRFLETDDEYFDFPVQLRSTFGFSMQGRWKINGIFLPDDVLQKIYYANALKLMPGLEAAFTRQLIGGR